ncbi:MAG: ABC transporter ATP-binding protein [Clostridia bacterium]|nr:ABC transporter ATP-binding protein [Clostridia bacterium]MBR3908092.1 ABC transporter ATP-binding protein [Clostridia bacterium]MBR6564265.1 ABC transporter ATP-binding protein [Clostridia bacterium]
MMEKTIEVKNLKINYRTMEPVKLKQLLKPSKRTVREHAVKGVSFDIYKGEIVGLIGQNGSGKSTTLRCLAGIISPDEGTVNLFGNSVSLLAIGVGFQKELTGRVNIMLSGLLMGFTAKEIKSKMKEIIEFSELGKAIDKPVSSYSSGMHSRLAFAITAILDTDILLVDEVLSVGDARFKKKSHQKMKELIMDKDRTVIMISHNLDTLASMCNRIIWLHKGEINMVGKPKEVLKKYNEFMTSGIN